MNLNDQPQAGAAAADPFVIAGKTYASRLLVGSGKYRDLDQTREATIWDVHDLRQALSPASDSAVGDGLAGDVLPRRTPSEGE